MNEVLERRACGRVVDGVDHVAPGDVRVVGDDVKCRGAASRAEAVEERKARRVLPSTDTSPASRISVDLPPEGGRPPCASQPNGIPRRTGTERNAATLLASLPLQRGGPGAVVDIGDVPLSGGVSRHRAGQWF